MVASEALQMKVSKDVVVDIKGSRSRDFPRFYLILVRSGQRTFQNLEGLAVQMFNNDPDVIAVMGSNYFDEKSWTEEVGYSYCYSSFICLVHELCVLLQHTSSWRRQCWR